MASRPTVLVFRSELLPYSQTFIPAQVRAMRDHHPVLVGTRRLPASEAADLGDFDIELVTTNPSRARVPWRAAGPPFDEESITRLARRRPTLVHAHFGADGFAAAPLAAALGVPLLVTFHGQDASRTATVREDWRQWWYEQRIPLLARRAAHLIAVSDHIRTRLSERGVPERTMSVQYIGVDTSRFRPAGEPRETDLIVAVGRLVEKKGFLVLADAIERLAAHRPGVRAVILGDGPLQSALEATPAARAGRLELLGALPPEEVQSWLARATVVAVPSHTARTGESEGLPTVLLEAMASGAAVIATDHAGNGEAIEDGVSGSLVPEADADALGIALSRMLADPSLRDRYGRAARERVLQRFDLISRTAGLEDLYQQVERRGRGGGK